MKNSLKNKVNQDLNTVRTIETQAIKKSRPVGLKLGEITIPKMPTDMEVMFLSKSMLLNLEQSTRYANMYAGLTKAYAEKSDAESLERMKEYKEMFEKSFEQQKKIASKVIANHPLSKDLCKIRGFSEYQLGIIMACMKDPRRFPSPSNLFVYAGVAPRKGIFVSKSNMSLHRMMKSEEFGEDKPDDYKEFGYNTTLQKRMYIIGECLIRSKGFFYDEYLKAREHLIQRAKNSGECFVAVEADRKENKNIVVGETYMRNKKNMTLKFWSHRNASWRQCRTLLHFIYVEWMKLLGEDVRALYAIEYLGHKREMTLDMCLNFESSMKNLKAEENIDDIEDI